MSLSAGGGSTITQSFIAEDGSIKWGRLTTAVFGGAWLAVTTGIVNTVLATVEVVAGLYTAIGGFLASIVTVLIGGPTTAISTSFAELTSFIATMGLLGFVAAVISTLLLAQIVSWGVQNVV